MVAARPFSGAHPHCASTLALHVTGCIRSLCAVRSLIVPFSVSAAFPTNLKYTSEHEWIEAVEEAKAGISDFAQEELGDIVYVDLPEASFALPFVGRRQNPSLCRGNFRMRRGVLRWARSLKKARHTPLLKASR